MTPDQFTKKIAEDYDLSEDAAELLFDEVWTYTLSYAARIFPVTKEHHGPVERSQVQLWLKELANGEEDEFDEPTG